MGRFGEKTAYANAEHGPYPDAGRVHGGKNKGEYGDLEVARLLGQVGRHRSESHDPSFGVYPLECGGSEEAHRLFLRLIFVPFVRG